MKSVEIFALIVARMGPEGRQRMRALLATAGLDGRSMFNRLKKPAQRATWSRFKAQAEYLDQVDELGDTAAWLAGITPSKIADFAGEAASQDVDTLSRYGPDKQVALVACLVHTARMRAREGTAGIRENPAKWARSFRTCPQPPVRTFPQVRSLAFTTRSVA